MMVGTVQEGTDTKTPSQPLLLVLLLVVRRDQESEHAVLVPTALVEQLVGSANEPRTQRSRLIVCRAASEHATQRVVATALERLIAAFVSFLSVLKLKLKLRLLHVRVFLIRTRVAGDDADGDAAVRMTSAVTTQCCVDRPSARTVRTGAKVLRQLAV